MILDDVREGNGDGTKFNAGLRTNMECVRVISAAFVIKKFPNMYGKGDRACKI